MHSPKAQLACKLSASYLNVMMTAGHLCSAMGDKTKSLAVIQPTLAAAGGQIPGGLSVLYENQAMRVEREELKGELKLISARVRAPA